MLWNIEIARNQAIKQLSKCPELAPCVKMELARKYDIEQWIGPAFNGLMNRDLNSYTWDEIETMGFDVYVIVSQTRERIAQERLYVAYVCPDTRRAQQCELEEHEACIKDWKFSWWNGFCKHLLHPERFLWGEMAIAKLETAKFPVMKETCLELTINKIRKSNRFNYREVFIEQGVQKLLTDQAQRKRNRVVGPPPKLFSKNNGEELILDMPIGEQERHGEDDDNGAPQELAEAEQLEQLDIQIIPV